MTEFTNIQSKILNPARSSNEYGLYRAGLEWDLIDPIVIESKEDVKSVERWRDRVEPYHHQVENLITFCRRLPVTLLADDVGLGKTISAGLIMSELIARSRLSRTLIVAPKLLGSQWKEELEWKFDIPVEVVTGRGLIEADPGELGAVVTTYHSAREYLEKIPADRFQMLILDEAHKLRNLYGVPKPPQVAVRFRKALEERRFPFVLMLTATPIQNRLWDLYSLVDLLTVARGHDNPFGSDGAFARKFIQGDRDKARQLKPESQEEFRSIVYGYMSRVRRGDAKLHFPERKVQLHSVNPTIEELELIAAVGRGIQKLNRLAQIGILQALTSSPQALSAQLDNMERNGTITPAFAGEVREIVGRMTTSAKLLGLGALIEKLKREQPEGWRLVVFTGRRETQTTIQLFLEGHGLSVGIINGSSGPRNQDTIARFRSNPPQLRVIVSTEAGSEGVNLQVANVLVNYDLPWNPMIVEQRIGRIQRLASSYASVAIFNVILSGTFEEYIVGRLMEKLQMSACAIGDIESLLETAGFEFDDESTGFEEKIRELVVAALQGVDVSEIVRMSEVSIARAKDTLEEEAQTIDELIGDSGGSGYAGPRAPSLPPIEHSMSEKEFTLSALSRSGGLLTEKQNGCYEIRDSNGARLIRFEDGESGAGGELYRRGSAAFSRLVQQTIASGVYLIKDLDVDPLKTSTETSEKWAKQIETAYRSSDCVGARRCFSGSLLLRTRATVAHDSYERLIEIPIHPKDSATAEFTPEGLKPIRPIQEDLVKTLSLPRERLIDAVEHDRAIAEFCRFYLERRAAEMSAAESDERKRKKMEDDFTPRLSISVVGAEGAIARDTRMRVTFEVEGHPYSDDIIVVPASGKVTSAPPLGRCEVSGRMLPSSCLGTCSITGTLAIRHLLSRSEASGRLALPSHMAKCELSGMCLVEDEVGLSSVTGRRVGLGQMKQSALTGKLAEAEYFGRCAFSGRELLLSELRKSDLSGLLFGQDEAETSVMSGKIGHKNEFVTCHLTGQSITRDEAELCEATGAIVRPGILVECEETSARVLPSEIRTSSVSGVRARKDLFVASSVSDSPLLRREAIASATQSFCKPSEARSCEWTGALSHPDDLSKCSLTGLSIRREYLTSKEPMRLDALQKLLDGESHTRAFEAKWEGFAHSVGQILGSNKIQITGAAASPTGTRAALCGELRSFFGFRVRQIGFIVDVATAIVQGRVPTGRRGSAGWMADD
jgi:superfamily II DNA or RNA helicase